MTLSDAKRSTLLLNLQTVGDYEDKKDNEYGAAKISGDENATEKLY